MTTHHHEIEEQNQLQEAMLEELLGTKNLARVYNSEMELT
jgi:hypothetical protein